MKTKRERLERLYERFHPSDRVLVTIDPDPDAIASAIAIKRLLLRRAGTVTIAAVKPITRWNNLTMVKLLKIPLHGFGTVRPEEYTKFVLVDGNPHHHPAFSSLPYSVIIDHHPFSPEAHWCTSSSPHIDIRPSYGATSSILTEYLKAARIKPSQSLATALGYGIKTDTRNFSRQTIEEDIRAFLFLYPSINRSMLTKIEISDLSKEELPFFEKAFQCYRTVHHGVFVFLGEGLPSHDILVIVAEFFLRIHDIFLSFAAGITGDDTVVVVGRSDGKSHHVGEFLKRAFGTIGSAGGHAAMGRAEIPLRAI